MATLEIGYGSYKPHDEAPLPYGDETALEKQRPELNTANLYDNLGDVAMLSATNETTVDASELSLDNHDIYKKDWDPETCEVSITSSVTLEDLEEIAGKEAMDSLRAAAAPMVGKRMGFYGATWRGGGVAIMRPPLVHALRLLGVDAHWYVMRPDAASFVETKRMHNIQQDVNEPGERLTEKGKRTIEQGLIANSEEQFLQAMSQDEVSVLDDPQPSRFARLAKEHHLPTKLIFRNHIQTDHELSGIQDSPQQEVQQYIWEENGVSQVDAYVVHPVDGFIPAGVPESLVVKMPATVDKRDGLNVPLSEQQVIRGLEFFDDQLAANGRQRPIDWNRKNAPVALIARFDESKGMEPTMDEYALARNMAIERGVNPEDLPQLLLIGNGSPDDPSGTKMLAKIMELRRTIHSDIMDDIKVARAPHNDEAINAVLHRISFGIQYSRKEGFEDRVTSAQRHGKPVIGSNVGGIPLQIVEGQSGHVVEFGKQGELADRMADLWADPDKYAAMSKSTEETVTRYNDQLFTTTQNALRWLILSNEVLTNPDFQGNKRWVEDLAPNLQTRSQAEALQSLKEAQHNREVRQAQRSKIVPAIGELATTA